MLANAAVHGGEPRPVPAPLEVPPAVPEAAPAGGEAQLRSLGFEILPAWKPQGQLRRFLAASRHLGGLLLGALASRVERLRAEGELQGGRHLILRVAALPGRWFLDRSLRGLPFPVQLRLRLERLGPTYIKLGQILSLREDLLPRSVTEELKRLLNHLPVVPFPVLRKVIELDLGRSLDAMFLWVDPVPLGSASIAQVHAATTLEGDRVLLKVVKPGIRQVLERDARLLRKLGAAAQLAFPRYRPRQVVEEFCAYTLREVDLRREAENAEIFAGHFADVPDVVFPRIYRPFCGRSVLCMEILEGLSPGDPAALALPEEDRRRLTDLGAMAIIRMLYRDGFFHADLHPGNLVILPGPKVGFIDLGMVGRLEEDLRRTLMHYYFSLVTGDAEDAARYLSALAVPGPGADPDGFRREAVDIANRWRRHANFKDFSLGQLILQSLSRGAEHGVSFPVELVLMVKALVTFEGVGNVLLPGFDVAEVSRRHIQALLLEQFSPLRLVGESLKGMPDLVEALVKVPVLVTDGLRELERYTRQPKADPFPGLGPSLLAASFVAAGTAALALKAPWPAWCGLFVGALVLALRKR